MLNFFEDFFFSPWRKYWIIRNYIPYVENNEIFSKTNLIIWQTCVQVAKVVAKG